MLSVRRTCPCSHSLQRMKAQKGPGLSSQISGVEWLHGQVRRTDSIALVHLMELLFKFLTNELNLEGNLVAEVMWRDYQRGGRRDKPQFLREFLLDALPPLSTQHRLEIPKRQARRMNWSGGVVK